MKLLSQKSVTDLFVNFLNEFGQWSEFETWLEDQGYKLEELGIEED
jgi:hypothetical protein